MFLNFIRSVVQLVKFFISKLNPKTHNNIKMKPVKDMSIKSEYKSPETRPKWVKDIFDDYIYGRIRSLTQVRERLKEGENNIINRCVRH